MHRKSLEAADKLKDCDQSDGDSRDQSNHSEQSNPTPLVNMNKNSPNATQPIGTSDKITQLSPQQTISTPIYNSVLSSAPKCSVREELRTSSIAVLRAKALEHSAKVNQIVHKTTDNNNLFASNKSPTRSPTPTPHYNHSSPSRHHVY